MISKIVKETSYLIIVLPLNYFLLSILKRERLDEGLVWVFCFFFFKPEKLGLPYISKHKGLLFKERGQGGRAIQFCRPLSTSSFLLPNQGSLQSQVDYTWGSPLWKSESSRGKRKSGQPGEPGEHSLYLNRASERGFLLSCLGEATPFRLPL